MCFNFCFCFFTWDSYKYSKLFSKIKKHDKIVLNNIYSYSGYGISFDTCGTFSLSNGGIGKNVLIFDADMSSSVHVDNKKRYVNSW